MKLAVPMMAAWYVDRKSLPLPFSSLINLSILIFIPTLLIAKQPDLGTALMVLSSGLCVIFLAGLRFRTILILTILFCSAAPFLWNMMHDYQKQRILTLLNPEQDPLGTGYHIIQSKIAIAREVPLGRDGYRAVNPI